MIHVVIPGKPVPYDRPRFNGKTRAVYNAGPYAAWKAGAAMLLRNGRKGAPPLLGPVALRVRAVHPRPVTRPGHLTIAEWKLPNVRLPAQTRADLDNIVKAAADSANDADVWTDDRQVCAIEAESWYAAIGEAPHVAVTIRPWVAALGAP